MGMISLEYGIIKLLALSDPRALDFYNLAVFNPLVFLTGDKCDSLAV